MPIVRSRCDVLRVKKELQRTSVQHGRLVLAMKGVLAQGGTGPCQAAQQVRETPLLPKAESMPGQPLNLRMVRGGVLLLPL